jgi:branched-chain amino acid transport system substrate-binding protein
VTTDSARMLRRTFLGVAGSVALAPWILARANPPKIRIGVLTDLSGIYRDSMGPTSVICTRQALLDFRAAGGSLDAEVLSADHQNKPDIGAAIARAWIDNDGVDVIADLPNSAVALAVAQVCRQKDKVHLNASATADALTGSQCSPNTIVWSFDNYMLARSTGGAMVKSGGDTWFFITADYAFGHSLEELTAALISKAGGKVLGRARYPFPETTDFSSYLAQAQASGAKVLGLANSSVDAVNCVKQASEFGLPQHGMRVAPLSMFLNNVRSLGLDAAQGLRVSASFYWDLNDRTRAFTKRVVPATPNNWPNHAHASAYGAAFHYLKVAAEMGAAAAKQSGAATVARMKQIPTDDDAFGSGSIREDGRGVFPAYLFEVKKPSESTSSWDLLKLVATTPAAEAVRPLAEEGCPLVHA